MERRGTKGKRPVLKNYGFLGVMLLSMFSVLFGFAANMAGGPETAVAGVMLRHITKPAVVSLGICSSVITIPTKQTRSSATRIWLCLSPSWVDLPRRMCYDHPVRRR